SARKTIVSRHVLHVVSKSLLSFHSLSILQICIGISFPSTNVPVERIFLVMNDIELMTKQR
ncbi:unnamed protein product, partial [Bubo scandiacus]